MGGHRNCACGSQALGCLGMMKVSVACPTFGRQRFLPNLIRYYGFQTHPDKELLILDDGPNAVEFLQDPKWLEIGVRYFHSNRRMSIGEKRNFLIQEAKGDVIVQFDDDDYYAPQYIEKMLAALGDADFLTLDGWFAYSMKNCQLGYWDTSQLHPFHARFSGQGVEWMDTAGFHKNFLFDNYWAYGFSFVYRKEVGLTCPFLDQNWGEDLIFYKDLAARGFQARTVSDHEGWTVHIIHEQNTSVSYPQYLLPSFLVSRLFGNEVQLGVALGAG
jgi:glycosyltransferase involved in cell wall biosynthesis